MKRLVIFGLGSCLGAAIDFVLGLTLIRFGVPGSLALALTMCVSATVVYAVHQRVTFADIGPARLSSRRLALFLVNTAMIYIFRVMVFSTLSLAGLTYAPALGLAIVSSLLVNFTVSRLVIFTGNESK